MTALSNLERQQRKIERERAAGFIRRTVTIPEGREAQLKQIVAEWLETDVNPPSASPKPHKQPSHQQ